MTVTTVEVCSVFAEGDGLDRTLRELNADGWEIRQIFQELPPTNYRIFAQRETLLNANNKVD